jgi:hypothetical protein
MTTPSVPESRAYRHQACGEETVISGDGFEVISNPLGDMSRTWCTKCNAFFPVSDYTWADSGEKITDYWARHSTRATQLERFLCSRAFLLIAVAVGFLAGCIGGYVLFRNADLLVKVLMVPFVGGVGVFAAAALHVSVICKLITRRVCGLSDTRVLT